MNGVACTFPSEAVRACRTQLRRWGYALKRSSGAKVMLAGELGFLSLECDLFNELGPLSCEYGVEGAVRAGKRVRLLHEMSEKPLRMNCCETGINLFLMYCAAGKADSTRLLRYRDGHPSDHFAVLHFEHGFSGQPVINDPLLGRLGMVKMLPDGFMYLPYRTSDGADDDQRIFQEMRRIKTEVTLLDESEAVRHVNFLNSPLGFFAYFQNGQKIRVDRKESALVVEYTAQTVNDELLLRVVCNDGLLDLFTFTRTFSASPDLQKKDSMTIHAGYEWTTPLHIIYHDRPGSDQGFMEQARCRWPGCPTKSAMALAEYLRQLQESGRAVFSRAEHQAVCSLWKSKQQGALERLCSHSAEIKTLVGIVEQRTGFESFPSERAMEEIEEAKQEYEGYGALVRYVDSLDLNQQRLFLDQTVFIEQFRRRRVQVRRPYGRIASRGAEAFLKEYCALRYGFFRGVINRFLDSDVVSLLLSQYRESLDIKRIVRRSAQCQ